MSFKEGPPCLNKLAVKQVLEKDARNNASI